MGLHCAVDLHGNNGYYAIVDEKGKRLMGKRLPNSLETVLRTLEPYKERLEAGVVVESTFNWYWLVDGLNENGYRARLANPAAIQQYDGLKQADDKTDAFFLTELSRLNILPEGFIYPKEERPVRDLLRRRMLLVRQRTAHILSFQNLVARERGEQIGSNSIRKLWPAEVEPFFDDSRLALMGQTNIETIRFLTKHIHKIEKTVLAEAKLKSEYEKLLTVPGIGQILALTDMLETGDIHRFAKAGNYTSYCRCVKSSRSSNDKKKGENNRKNGNCYLNWMYVEAANFMRRYCPEAKRWHQRKAARSKQVVATKALASKICKACYFIMRDQKEFDVKMMFG
jgi:transposase